MKHKELIKNIILKGLYIGLVWYASDWAILYIFSKLPDYRFNFIIVGMVGQLIGIILAYGFVEVVTHHWRASKRTKALVISLSILITAGFMAYNLLSLLKMSA